MAPAALGLYEAREFMRKGSISWVLSGVLSTNPSCALVDIRGHSSIDWIPLGGVMNACDVSTVKTTGIPGIMSAPKFTNEILEVVWSQVAFWKRCTSPVSTLNQTKVRSLGVF
jgi:hypothetical protein